MVEETPPPCFILFCLSCVFRVISLNCLFRKSWILSVFSCSCLIWLSVLAFIRSSMLFWSGWLIRSISPLLAGTAVVDGPPKSKSNSPWGALAISSKLFCFESSTLLGSVVSKSKIPAPAVTADLLAWELLACLLPRRSLFYWFVVVPDMLKSKFAL